MITTQATFIICITLDHEGECSGVTSYTGRESDCPKFRAVGVPSLPL